MWKKLFKKQEYIKFTVNNVQIGDIVSFMYLQSHRKIERCIKVVAIRDLNRQPVKSETIKRRTNLKRGQYLILGTDLKGKYGQFYDTSIVCLRKLTPMEILELSTYGLNYA